ncbi:sodium:proton exchanger [Labedella populi]|uniref:Sodium:proton exchanger n=1 Tax=Labedella populi TaxID=2498850 RepID=A0A3S4DZ64_9MICO|nr:cation:proton antiporter [Labedella populi]RWZ59624.1 sodium:proton exchanger [Labedella populi]
MDLNLPLALFAGVVLMLSVFSSVLQRASLPGPVIALGLGVLLGPFALDLVRIEEFGIPTGTLLEEAARLTLGIGLAGVALRLPHGYWRANRRWLIVILGVGMPLMLAVATGVLWAGLGLPILVALLLGAILTPTDPVVTTPVVTGSLATERVPDRVRFNLSSESGINDGLGYLFVMLPVLLLTTPGRAWQDFVLTVLVREVIGAAVFGLVVGYAAGKLFVAARSRGLMEESSYLGFIVPLGLVVLGAGKLLGTDAILAVFIAAAVFGQIIPQSDEKQEDTIDDVVNRFFLLPIFLLIGLALPIGEWAERGWIAPVVVIAAVLLRRFVAVWALRPLLRRLHSRGETMFLSWFGPIGVSALFYATLAERQTGLRDVFVYTTLAITVSVVVHGVSTAPASALIARHRADHRDGTAA